MRFTSLTLFACLGLSTAAIADDKPAAKPAEAKPASDASAEIKAGTGVEKFEITGESATFPAGTTVWVWTRIKNAEGNVKHVWKRDGKEAWTATLAVGGKNWATQSRRTIPKAGEWAVEVQTEAGASLGSVKFTVQ